MTHQIFIMQLPNALLYIYVCIQATFMKVFLKKMFIGGLVEGINVDLIKYEKNQ